MYEKKKEFPIEAVPIPKAFCRPDKCTKQIQINISRVTVLTVIEIEIEIELGWVSRIYSFHIALPPLLPLPQFYCGVQSSREKNNTIKKVFC